MKIAVIICAGGSGVRIGGLKAPKQFSCIDGKPMFIRCLETYDSMEEVDEVCLVINKQFFKQAETLLKKHKIVKLKAIVPGGKARQDSIRHAYKRVKDAEFIIVHNAVSPLVSTRLVRQCIKTARDKKGVATGYMPAFHTVFKKHGTRLGKVLERSTLGYACDPQVFPGEVLDKIFKKVREGLSKDCPMLQSTTALGYTIHLVESEPENIKTTFGHDLDAIESILKKRKKAGR